jgi:hypothetical protein
MSLSGKQTEEIGRLRTFRGSARSVSSNVANIMITAQGTPASRHASPAADIHCPRAKAQSPNSPGRLRCGLPAGLAPMNDFPRKIKNRNLKMSAGWPGPNRTAPISGAAAQEGLDHRIAADCGIAGDLDSRPAALDAISLLIMPTIHLQILRLCLSSSESCAANLYLRSRCPNSHKLKTQVTVRGNRGSLYFIPHSGTQASDSAAASRNRAASAPSLAPPRALGGRSAGRTPDRASAGCMSCRGLEVGASMGASVATLPLISTFSRFEIGGGGAVSSSTAKWTLLGERYAQMRSHSQ